MAGQSKASKRAYRLRKKAADGKPLSAEEQSFLDGYTPGKAGRPKAGARVRTEDHAPGAPGDAAHVVDGPGDPGGDDDGVAPEFGTPAGETPAPDAPPVRPRSEKSAGAKGGKGDWRSKYRPGAASGEREATCLEAAALWVLMLKKMNASIRENGGTPIIADDAIDGTLSSCIVLTVDKLLPADFSVGPEVQAAVASTTITAQAWWTARGARRAKSSKAAGSAYVNPTTTEADAKPPTPATDGGDRVALAIVRGPKFSPPPDLSNPAIVF